MNRPGNAPLIWSGLIRDSSTPLGRRAFYFALLGLRRVWRCKPRALPGAALGWIIVAPLGLAKIALLGISSFSSSRLASPQFHGSRSPGTEKRPEKIL